MSNLKPDTSVLELNRDQPEFNEQLWQYLNRRVSDYRITTGKQKAKEYSSLLSRVRKLGVDRFVMLALWGIESAYGDPDVQKNHMRPVIPALAATRLGRAAPPLVTGKPELLNALTIIDRGWAHADGHARLLGRRNGSHPMDARSLARRRRRLRR